MNRKEYLLYNLKRYLEPYKAYHFVRDIKTSFKKILSDDPNRRKIIHLKPGRTPRGSVLLSYLVAPFLSRPGRHPLHSHSNEWKPLLMARTFLDLGYSVDDIDWTNQV